jgi:hypothetical protein
MDSPNQPAPAPGPARLFKLRLLWRKFTGCTREFGLLEALRRAHKEVLKTVARRKRAFCISWIDERTAIGGAPITPAELEELKAHGVTDVIDLRAERSFQAKTMFHNADIQAFWVPTYDDWLPKSWSFFTDLKDTIDLVYQDRRRKLLICCGAGEHRAPLGGVVALIVQGESLETASKMVERSHPAAEFLPTYIRSLQKYVKSEFHTYAKTCSE